MFFQSSDFFFVVVEYGYVYVNDVQKWSHLFSHGERGLTNVCGQSVVDAIDTVTFTHSLDGSSNELTLKATTDLDSPANDESFGIWDIKLNIRDCNGIGLFFFKVCYNYLK